MTTLVFTYDELDSLRDLDDFIPLISNEEHGDFAISKEDIEEFDRTWECDECYEQYPLGYDKVYVEDTGEAFCIHCASIN